MSEEKKEERKSVRTSLSSATVNAASTVETVGSDVIEALDHLVKLRWIEAAKDSWMAMTDLGSGMLTTAQLGWGMKLSAAPETLHITKEQFQLLHFMINPLKEWSRHEFPTRMDIESFSEDDVKVFLAAARVMTVASALAYVDQKDAQDIVDDGWVVGKDKWRVKVLEYGGAQAMLLLEENIPPNDGAERNPVVVLSFRGTELPDDEANGARQFVPDWWRNLSFRLTHYREDDYGGSVAKGFLEAWRGIRDGEPGLERKIRSELIDYGRKVDLFITGHSQGGALAAVSLLDLLDEDLENAPYTVCGCLTLAQPKYGDEEHSEALRDKVVQKKIPFDLVANEDGTGVDAVVSLGGPLTKMPVGRFWKVRAGHVTHGPVTQEIHKEIVEASLSKILWRGATSAPLHWPGGPHGYLAALEK